MAPLARSQVAAGKQPPPARSPLISSHGHYLLAPFPLHYDPSRGTEEPITGQTLKHAVYLDAELLPFLPLKKSEGRVTNPILL
ncbi:hypothetical protein J6590_033471 [Homalodisca vitripennis]|nr:hypothetical protein J6590_033471 [Homalodisca vitripennis]